MTTNDDDFWGNQAAWPEVPEGDRRGPRPGAGARVSGWWNRIVGGGVEGTREHGRLGTAGRGHDEFDPDDFDLVHDEPIDEPDPVRRAAAEPTNPTEVVDEAWDDEWIIASDPTPSPGVDPLLARLGGLAIVTTLLVPLALGLRSHDDSPAATDVTSAAVTAVAAASAPVDTIVPTTVAAPTAAPDTASSTPGAPAASSAPVTAAPEPATTAAASAPTASSAAEPASAADQGDAAAATAALNAEATEPVQSCAIDYEVVEGDFWIRLADGAAVELDELLDANDATTDTPLYPGATICLPDGATVPAPPTTAAPVTTTPATTASKPATTTKPAITKPVATTKPVTTAAPTTTAKPVVTYPMISAAAAAQIIRDVWPDELEDRAIEIATRESSLGVTAKNSCCYGLFQINWNSHKSWLGGLGVSTPEQLFDAATNAGAAFALYQRSGGWGPWT